MALSALLDTTVLAPPVLADTVLRLAETGYVEPRWSADVTVALHRELSGHPALGDRGAARRVRRMADAFPDALVTGYEPLVEVMAVEPSRRHLLAAAVRAGCQVLVTTDVGAFRSRAVARHGVEVTHPDDFLLDALDLDPTAVMTALDTQLAARTTPPPLGTFLGQLEGSGVPRFATELRRRAGR